MLYISITIYPFSPMMLMMEVAKRPSHFPLIPVEHLQYRFGTTDG